MDKRKQKRLEAAGWQVGSAAEFLGLSEAEAQLVEMKLALSAQLRTTRQRRHWTQTALAKRLGSSQSRVAKMETGDPSRVARSPRARPARSGCNAEGYRAHALDSRCLAVRLTLELSRGAARA